MLWLLAFYLFVIWLTSFVCFGDMVSLCSLGCSGIHFVEQAGLELRDLTPSASQVLELKTRVPPLLDGSSHS